MKPILVAGGGIIGSVIARVLQRAGGYQVTVADQNDKALTAIQNDIPGVEIRHLDFTQPDAIGQALQNQFAVLNALPYRFAGEMARQAVATGTHYLDLTEDVASTRIVKTLAEKAATALIPQCGLAPGFVSIAAADLAREFNPLHSMKLRVGALPLYPNNALKYNLTWNTEGLINEYLKPCEALIDGQLREVPALEELEQFTLDGVTYEAFNTSGGLGTLCETLAGRCRYLNYRTVRYPGHRDLIKLLIQDLRMGEEPALLKQVLEKALPATLQDVVLVVVSASGERGGRLMQQSLVRKIYAQPWFGDMTNAIQITTAAGICTVLDLLASGQLPDRGFIRQEDISLKDFLSNRFGQVYDPTQQDRPNESETMNNPEAA